jgi:hypothetical protein
VGRRPRWIQLFGVPLALALVAVGILLLFTNLVGPVMAEIDQTSVTVVNGEAHARVSWSSGTALITIPLEYQTAAEVPIKILPDGTARFDDSNQGFTVPAYPLLLIVAAIGAMLGLVVVGNVRGFGFIRGTGELGTMQPGDVDEDRGFYWRS